MRAPRKLFADCSPSTQLMASLRFDLPHPFGPTIAAIPPPLNRSSVRSQKDLKPCSSSRLSLSKTYLPLCRRGVRPARGIVTILNAIRAKVKHSPTAKWGPLAYAPRYCVQLTRHPRFPSVTKLLQKSCPGH